MSTIIEKFKKKFFKDYLGLVSKGNMTALKSSKQESDISLFPKAFFWHQMRNGWHRKTDEEAIAIV